MAIAIHDTLYFDRIERTEKLRTLVALANASYNIIDKERVIKCLEVELDIFKSLKKGELGSGSYVGTEKQFRSKYTLGRDFGVLVESSDKMILSELAKRLAKGLISAQYYMSTVMLNYIQIIDGKVVNPIKTIIDEMNKCNKDELTKDEIKKIRDFNLNGNDKDGNVNGLFDILKETYFFLEDQKSLKINNEIFNRECVLNLVNKDELTISALEVEKKYKDNQQAWCDYLGKENIKLKQVMCGFKNAISKKKVKYSDLDSSEIVNTINNYINNEGFNYSKDSLKNFYLSLKAKPFVILAGISGTGKSKLVKLFAKAIGAKYNLISVKPDWNDSTDLLGYKNLNDKFIPGQLTEIILEASKDENKDKPYFVCLDEMNLARVEYYFSEYLSLIESRKRENDSIVTDKIFDSEDAEYNDLVFPDNLYIVGTVNMDDTTFGFSKKVLDRANTIEFSDVDLTLDFLNNSGEANEIVGVDNSFLKTNFISLKEIIHSNEIENKFIEDINNRIIEINNILKQYSRHFAYRVRDEILIYMAENKISNLFLEENSELTEEENEEISISKAFDYQIMQKILPLISGSDEYTRDILIDLFNYAFDKKERKEYIIDESNYRDKIDGIDLEKAKYKLTAKKLKDMLRGYDNGYATYWQ